MPLGPVTINIQNTESLLKFIIEITETALQSPKLAAGSVLAWGHNSAKDQKVEVCEVAQRLKVLAAEPGNLSLIPSSHMVLLRAAP